MAKERFVEVYNQGIVNVIKIVVDTETGINYVLGSHNKATGTGMTVLLGADGKPLVTPVDSTDPFNTAKHELLPPVRTKHELERFGGIYHGT